MSREPQSLGSRYANTVIMAFLLSGAFIFWCGLVGDSPLPYLAGVWTAALIIPPLFYVVNDRPLIKHRQKMLEKVKADG